MVQWITSDEAAQLVPDRAKVALGGAHRLAPVALVKALIRRSVKDLHLITTPTGGFGAELLIAGGAVRAVETAQISLAELGLAPAFRRAAEEGRLKIFEST
ncbi:MAG: hypothetical protein JRJ59_10250 [Deltaproteobacteria bacterium]|nr:hypothetical protein [Deltaproteobacteria bacterium]